MIRDFLGRVDAKTMRTDAASVEVPELK